MTGSRKLFKYTDDANTQFYVEKDESNMENAIIDNAAIDFTVADEGVIDYALPNNVSPRVAVYQSTTSRTVKEVIAPTAAIYAAFRTKDATIVNITFTDEPTGEEFRLRRVRPETVTLPFAQDTGKTDGDAT